MKIITDRKIRFALVGCGRISKNHFGSFAKHAEDIEVVGICDTNPQVLAETVKETGFKGYATLTEMIKKSNADIISICTPSGTHPQQVIEIAKSGCHVLSEKPMATRWQDGVDMVKVCDDAGVYFFVVKQNRMNSTLQMLKQAIDKKRFGKIYMVNLNVFWTRPQEYYDSADWRGTWEFDGGAFMNQASHYVDLLDWLFGPIASLQAMTATLARDIEVEDTGVMNIKWRTGALGSMSVTMLTYPKNLEGSITVLGEKGTVRIGGLAVNEIQEWSFADIQPEDEKIKDANYQTTSVYGFGHPLYYKNVIEVLRGKAEPETDGREGLKSLETLIAAYLSARDNKTVSLPLNY